MSEKYEDLRDRVFKDLSQIARDHSGPEAEAEKVSYLQNMSDVYRNKVIIDEEGEDRTSDFIEGLFNIITDPAGRITSYRFESIPLSVGFSPIQGYSNISAHSRVGREAFVILHESTNYEVGRCVLNTRISEDYVLVEYAEIIDAYKSTVRLSDAIKDGVLEMFGFRKGIEWADNFQGIPAKFEDVTKASLRN